MARVVSNSPTFASICRYVFLSELYSGIKPDKCKNIYSFATTQLPFYSGVHQIRETIWTNLYKKWTTITKSPSQPTLLKYLRIFIAIPNSWHTGFPGKFCKLYLIIRNYRLLSSGFRSTWKKLLYFLMRLNKGKEVIGKEIKKPFMLQSQQNF